jgi:hypothetical protein
MLLRVPPWFRSHLSHVDRAEIAAATPSDVLVTFLKLYPGYRCRLWARTDDYRTSRLLAEARVNGPAIEAFRAAREQTRSYARWQNCDVEVVS